MSHPGASRDVRRSRQDRDRALSRVAKTTAAGGVGAVLVAGALAAWLSTPAHARAGSTSTTSSSTATSSPTATSEQDDDGLQPTSAPTTASGDTGSQQPTVVSGGS